MTQRGQAVAVTARAPRAPLLSLVVSLVLVSPITALVVWPQARTGLLPRACAAHPRCAVAGAATSNGDLYAALGIDATASAAEVKRAYRRAALRNHPDVNKAADAQEAFARIAEAYTVLSDPEQRAKYDRKRRASGGGWASGASRPGATTGWDRGGGGKRGARPSAGRSDEWEARRRAEEARYDTGGDSFGALLGDLVSATAKAFGGGAGGWVSLLEELAPMEPDGLAELLSSTDTAALSAELDSAQFVVARLEERCAALQAELGRTEAELASLSARGAGAGGAAIERSYERELRREAAARRDRLASARALLSRAEERRTKLCARLQQLRSTATDGGGASDSDGASSRGSGGSGGSGGAYRSAGRRASDRGGTSARGRAAEREASRRGSVEDELDALKRRMGRK
mmetsp:Transcript_43131/g.139904  ORF Transcript_43131/g.139904 Transcript_43131/m.139904 type:complete len:404 (+) Transcript_43131:37-1248(+)